MSLSSLKSKRPRTVPVRKSKKLHPQLQMADLRPHAEVVVGVVMTVFGEVADELNVDAEDFVVPEVELRLQQMALVEQVQRQSLL